jgi:hypothetical protein
MLQPKDDRMKKSLLACFALLLLLVCTPSARADSPVWRVAKGDAHLFIGGTVHVLSQDAYPLPEAFEKAYQASSIIVFEADIQEMQTPEFQQALVEQASYPEGRDLTMFLTDDTRAHLVQFLSSRQLPMDNLVKFKAGMVSVTLTIVELQRLGLAGSGVDQFFSLRAARPASSASTINRRTVRSARTRQRLGTPMGTASASPSSIMVWRPVISLNVALTGAAKFAARRRPRPAVMSQAIQYRPARRYVGMNQAIAMTSGPTATCIQRNRAPYSAGVCACMVHASSRARAAAESAATAKIALSRDLWSWLQTRP